MKASSFFAVVRYEIRVVARCGVFRTLTALILLCIYFLYSLKILRSIGIPLPQFFAHKIPFFPHPEIHPASQPYHNVILSTIGLSLPLIIAAAMSIRREKSLDTLQAIHCRSISNLIYVTGKAAACLIVFLTLTFTSLIPALIINLTTGDVPVHILDYFIYPGLIAFPVFVFIIGTVFLMAMRVNSRITSFFIVIPMLLTGLFWSGGPYRSIFDVFCIHAPLLRTTIAGFSDFSQIILTRPLFLMSGIASLVMSTFLFKREIQSKGARALGAGITIISMIIVMTSGVYLFKTEYSGRRLRERMKDLDKVAASDPEVVVDKYTIRVWHKDDIIECKAKIALRNTLTESLDKFLLTLNPGMEVTSVNNSTGSLMFERDIHHLWVIPDPPLESDAVDTITVSYKGTIEDDACYLFISDYERWLPRKNRLSIDLSHPGKRYSYIEKELIVLLPGIQWYPTPGVYFDPARPELSQNDFYSFDLEFSSENELIPVSQGDCIKTPDGKTAFTPDTPLTGISLLAGNYRHRSIEVDSITYSSYTFDSCDDFDDHFANTTDTIPSLIRQLCDDLFVEKFFSYPFNRFTVIEVPEHFHWFDNPLWPGGSSEHQPEIVLFDRDRYNNSLFISRFRKNIEQNNARTFGTSPSEKEIEAQALQWRLQEFQWIPYQANFRNRLVSSRYPVLSKAFDIYLELHNNVWSLEHRMKKNHYDNPKPDDIGRLELTNIYLRGNSLEDILHSPNPPDSLVMAVKLKGMFLFTMLEAKIGKERFRKSVHDLFDDKPFSKIDLSELSEKVKTDHGVDIGPIVNEWAESRHQPGYLFSDIRLLQAEGADGTMYNMRGKVSNPENVDGVIVIETRRKGETLQTPFVIEGGTTKEFGLILHRKPGSWSIFTLLSLNLPNSIRYSRFDEAIPVLNNDFFEGARVIEEIDIPDSNTIIVDNEDEGFEIHNEKAKGLSRLFSGRIGTEPQDGYIRLKPVEPEKWTPCMDNMTKSLYGKYRKTAVFIKSGTGGNFVAWNSVTRIKGQCDVYAWLSKPWPHRKEEYQRICYDHLYHYTVFHSEGTSLQPINWFEAENGWNLIGRYYFEEGPVRVELSDESTDGHIIADAVKWVRR